MKKWMPIRGDFAASGEDVIFQGEALSSNKSTLFNPYMGQKLSSADQYYGPTM